jgi:hypothetical protein
MTPRESQDLSFECDRLQGKQKPLLVAQQDFSSSQLSPKPTGKAINSRNFRSDPLLAPTSVNKQRGTHFSTPFTFTSPNDRRQRPKTTQFLYLFMFLSVFNFQFVAWRGREKYFPRRPTTFLVRFGRWDET